MIELAEFFRMLVVHFILYPVLSLKMESLHIFLALLW